MRTRRSISRPAVAAYVYALVMALSVAYFVTGIPLQLTDSLANLLIVNARPLPALMQQYFQVGGGQLRPFLFGQLRVAFVLANGHYFLMFKTIQVVQIILCALLLVRLVRPVTWARAASAALGIVVLFGGHTFTGTIMEAFPINTYLTIVVSALMAANLAFSEPGWPKDVAAVAILAFAIFTVETGVLVFVVVVAARLAGARGISRAGIAGLCAVLAMYVLVRVSGGQLAGPPLTERSAAGFGFGVLGGQELQARFGERPWLFYAYNVTSQVSTVLFAEPREGVWQFAYAATHDQLQPRQEIAVLSSTGLTLLIAGLVASRFARWRRWALDHDEQLVTVFVAVLGANAAVSYPYVKDVIVSVAGAFFAAAGAVAVAHVLASLPRVRVVSAVAMTMLLAALAAGWCVRTIGAEWNLRRYAFIVRNEWTDLDRWVERNHQSMTSSGWQLARALQQDALERQTPAPAYTSPRAERFLLP